MAWIEEWEGERTGILIDGYIPNLKQLNELKRRRLLSIGKEDEISPDQLFENLLLFQTTNFHKKAQEEGKIIYPEMCDLYIFKFKKAPFHPEISPLFEEMTHDKSPNYRQILFTYDERYCKLGKKCIRNVLNALEFKFKKPKEYLDLSSYKKACSALLDKVILTPYIAPNIVTTERMEYFGFKGRNL